MSNPCSRVASPKSHRPPGGSLIGAGVLSLVVSLSACGGHDAAASRPSVKQIAASLTSGPLAKEMGLDRIGASPSAFTCIAQKLEKSELSDAALQALVKADDSFAPSDSDQKALADLLPQMGSCAAG